jgi:hypothetical protein
MTTTKIGSTDFSLPHAYFIEHITGMIETPPRKHDKKLEKIKPWFQWFKNKTDFHLKKTFTKSENGNPWQRWQNLEIKSDHNHLQEPQGAARRSIKKMLPWR